MVRQPSITYTRAWKSASEAEIKLMIVLSKSELYSMCILAILKLRTTAHLWSKCTDLHRIIPLAFKKALCRQVNITANVGFSSVGYILFLGANLMQKRCISLRSEPAEENFSSLNLLRLQFIAYTHPMFFSLWDCFCHEDSLNFWTLHLPNYLKRKLISSTIQLLSNRWQIIICFRYLAKDTIPQQSPFFNINVAVLSKRDSTWNDWFLYPYVFN